MQMATKSWAVLSKLYTYIGFKLGTWDDKEGKVNYNPESKMADKSLRQAMGYALDNDAVGSRFYNGLRSNATTLIPPVFGTLHDTEVKGYTQDIDKAKQIVRRCWLQRC